MNPEARIAGAPISWGIIEVPDWGYQLDARRVLREASAVGLRAMEAGPDGFLPRDPPEVSRVLGERELGLVGGFVPAVLHEPERREAELAVVEQRARFFAEAGADVLVLSAASGPGGYEEVFELDERAWRELFETLLSVERVCDRHGLELSLHPHFGTVIERDHHLWRFLEGCDTGLCLDTGHLMIGGADPVEVVRRAADRVNHVHLKDVDRELAQRVAAGELGFKEAAQRGVFRPLGDGEVDVGRVLRLLREAGYRGWYVLEQDIVVEAEPAEGEGPVHDVRKSLEFLERQFEG